MEKRQQLAMKKKITCIFSLKKKESSTLNVGDFFMKILNKLSILFVSVLLFFAIIEINYYFHLSNINLTYLIEQFEFNYFKIAFFNGLILFVYFFLFFGIMDFLYDKILIKHYSMILYLCISFFMTGIFYFILYLNVEEFTFFNVHTVLSFFTTISFCVIFNLYSFYYQNFIDEKREKNKSLPEPISSKFD